MVEYVVMNIRRSPVILYIIIIFKYFLKIFLIIQFTTDVYRSYEKIDQFLAYVGGFVATLLGAFSGFITFFKKPHY